MSRKSTCKSMTKSLLQASAVWAALAASFATPATCAFKQLPENNKQASTCFRLFQEPLACNQLQVQHTFTRYRVSWTTSNMSRCLWSSRVIRLTVSLLSYQKGWSRSPWHQESRFPWSQDSESQRDFGWTSPSHELSATVWILATQVADFLGCEKMFRSALHATTPNMNSNSKSTDRQVEWKWECSNPIAATTESSSRSMNVLSCFVTPQESSSPTIFPQSGWLSLLLFCSTWAPEDCSACPAAKAAQRVCREDHNATSQNTSVQHQFSWLFKRLTALHWSLTPLDSQSLHDLTGTSLHGPEQANNPWGWSLSRRTAGIEWNQCLHCSLSFLQWLIIQVF